MLSFACISPHPPLLLPAVSSTETRDKVKKTIQSLESLGQKLENAKPTTIFISSPHSDWGFNVPLHFLAKNFKGEIKTYLTGIEPPRFYYEIGRKACISLGTEPNRRVAFIASGDLSHRLTADGPYGFHPDGPKFDETLIRLLRKKDIESILELDNTFPEAAECGLRSFCLLLGFLRPSAFDWQTEILSYEGPFGVGYLTANIKLG